MGLNDPYIAGDRALGKYSYLRKLKKHENWVLIDCGSHNGKFAEKLSSHLTPSQIMFIDINKEFNSLLKARFPRAKIINRAISTKRGFLYLVRNEKNSGQNFASSRFKTQEKIKTVTLFEIFNLRDKKPNEDIFLKMDIEGNEIKILKSLPQEMYANISVISIEILPGNETLNFVDQLNDFIPPNYKFFRERRYGLTKVNRNNPHWTDNLNLFQNLILIRSTM